MFALPAVALATYFPGLDFLFSILYIVILTREFAWTSMPEIGSKVIFAISLHIPGFILAFINLMNITQGDISSYALFILQYWYIPLLPLLSLVSFTSEAGMPVYYYLLLGLPLLLSFYTFTMITITGKKHR